VTDAANTYNGLGGDQLGRGQRAATLPAMINESSSGGRAYHNVVTTILGGSPPA